MDSSRKHCLVVVRGGNAFLCPSSSSAQLLMQLNPTDLPEAGTGPGARATSGSGKQTVAEQGREAAPPAASTPCSSLLEPCRAVSACSPVMANMYLLKPNHLDLFSSYDWATSLMDRAVDMIVLGK